MLNEWRKNCQNITPPEGTSTDDILANELFQYCVNGPQAKERIQIRLGSCLTEEGFHFFKYQSFLTHLGNDWKISKEKIGQKLKERFKVEFNYSLKVEGKVEKVCKLKQLHIDKIEYKPVERKGSNY